MRRPFPFLFFSCFTFPLTDNTWSYSRCSRILASSALHSVSNCCRLKVAASLEKQLLYIASKSVPLDESTSHLYGSGTRRCACGGNAARHDRPSHKGVVVVRSIKSTHLILDLPCSSSDSRKSTSCTLSDME